MSDSWRKNAIAVTGIAGSGKSTVTRLLREMGAFTMDADELAREVVEPGSPALGEIQRAFGNDVMNADGTLNRKKLGAVIFHDTEKRRQLERITHPRIRDLAAARAAEAEHAPLVVYDCPLLFEAGLDGFKKIVVVSSDEASAVRRMMARANISREEAVSRLRAQLPLEEKKRRADIVIENNGTLEELREQVQRIFDSLTGKRA